MLVAISLLISYQSKGKISEKTKETTKTKNTELST